MTLSIVSCLQEFVDAKYLIQGNGDGRKEVGAILWISELSWIILDGLNY